MWCRSLLVRPLRQQPRLFTAAHFPFRHGGKRLLLAAAVVCGAGLFWYETRRKTFEAAEGENTNAHAYGEDTVATQKKLQAEMHGKKAPIYRIVLTGGPCGGKSTAMAQISDRLLSLGFRVFRVPEAATLIITGTGINPGNMEEGERQVFEATIIKTKMALEDLYYSLAAAGSQPCVIICDRGTMDTAAYMSNEDFDVMLDEYKWNLVELRDKRYDAVIHLVTAAIGAEKFYTTENNAARSEDLVQARDLDFKVLNGWVGHPHIRVVDNSTDFAQKINRVEEIICQVVGAPRPNRGERKFLLSGDRFITNEVASSAGIKVESFQVEQVYLTKTDPDVTGYNYVRRRGSNGTYTYTHSMVRQSGTEIAGIGEGESVILERPISGREYIALLKQADPAKAPVKKKVQCFLWNNVVYELQTYVDPDISLTILKTEVDPRVKLIQFPWFLNVKGEITEEKLFSSYELASHFRGGNKPPSWKDNQVLREAYQNAKLEFEQRRKKADINA